MLSRLSRAVAALKTQMVRNLPQTISSRLAGLMSSVSIVPRSFSPAHRSTAGYSAPASDHITRMNGNMRSSRLNKSVLARSAARRGALGVVDLERVVEVRGESALRRMRSSFSAFFHRSRMALKRR